LADHLSTGAAVVSMAAGASLTAVLEQASVAFFGVPLAAVTAAMTGAMVPALLLDAEPLREALRRWLGSVALALVATALLLHVLGLEKPHAIGVAGLVAAFGRDIFSAVRGQLGPLAAAVRELVTRNRKEG